MTRGRKFRSTRRTPESERSYFEQKLTGRYSRTLDRNDLLNLIRGGEDTYLEFKIRLVNTEKITAEIVAMANAEAARLSSAGAISGDSKDSTIPNRLKNNSSTSAAIRSSLPCSQ